MLQGVQSNLVNAASLVQEFMVSMRVLTRAGSEHALLVSLSLERSDGRGKPIMTIGDEMTSQTYNVYRDKNSVCRHDYYDLCKTLNGSPDIATRLAVAIDRYAQSLPVHAYPYIHYKEMAPSAATPNDILVLGIDMLHWAAIEYNYKAYSQSSWLVSSSLR